MSGFMGALMASVSMLASFGGGRSSTSSTAGTYTVGFSLGSDGTASSSGGTGSVSATWVNTPYAGVGSQVWCKVGTPTGGGTYSGATANTWLSMASGISCSISNGGASAEFSGNIPLTFATDSAGANVIGTGSFSYDVGRLF